MESSGGNPFLRFIAVFAVGVGALAGAIGATNPDSLWARVLFVVATVCLLGAIIDVGVWLFRRSRKRRESQETQQQKSNMNDLIRKAARPGVEERRAERASRVGQHEPRDPSKDYTGISKSEVSGQGRFRSLRFTLHEIGSGYDRGVECEVTGPHGERAKETWSDLQLPGNRRRLAEKGNSVWAREEGPYVAIWSNSPLSGYEPDVIARDVVPLGPTGPLEGWTARHELSGDQLLLRVCRDTDEQGQLYRFRCELKGPSGDFWAEDDSGTIPQPKHEAQLVYPRDFQGEVPSLPNLIDGTYDVFWEAKEQSNESDPLEPVDVARDAFHVTRKGQIT